MFLIFVCFHVTQVLQIRTARQSFWFITVGVLITSVPNSISQETDTNSDSMFKPNQVLTVVIFNIEFMKPPFTLSGPPSYITNDFYAISISLGVPRIEIKLHYY